MKRLLGDTRPKDHRETRESWKRRDAWRCSDNDEQTSSEGGSNTRESKRPIRCSPVQWCCWCARPLGFYSLVKLNSLLFSQHISPDFWRRWNLNYFSPISRRSALWSTRSCEYRMQKSGGLQSRKLLQLSTSRKKYVSAWKCLVKQWHGLGTHHENNLRNIFSMKGGFLEFSQI